MNECLPGTARHHADILLGQLMHYPITLF